MKIQEESVLSFLLCKKSNSTWAGLGKSGFKNSKLGVVTFIQRFGSALNLNVHFHSLVADGFFYRLPMPNQDDLESIAVKIKSLEIYLKEFSCRFEFPGPYHQVLGFCICSKSET